MNKEKTIERVTPVQALTIACLVLDSQLEVESAKSNWFKEVRQARQLLTQWRQSLEEKSKDG